MPEKVHELLVAEMLKFMTIAEVVKSSMLWPVTWEGSGADRPAFHVHVAAIAPVSVHCREESVGSWREEQKESNTLVPSGQRGAPRTISPASVVATTVMVGDAEVTMGVVVKTLALDDVVMGVVTVVLVAEADPTESTRRPRITHAVEKVACIPVS